MDAICSDHQISIVAVPVGHFHAHLGFEMLDSSDPTVDMNL